jgi:hypothetical protein
MSHAKAGLMILLLTAAAAASDLRCNADSQKLCAGKDWSSGLTRCLQSHQRELSAECRSLLHTRVVRAKNLMRACQADARELCATIPPGPGALAQCLKSHRDLLSPDCRAQFTRTPH